LCRASPRPPRAPVAPHFFALVGDDHELSFNCKRQLLY
jgi:hypothetical protein